MNGLDFLKSMSEVDPVLVSESEKAFQARNRPHGKRWILLAACLCLCVCVCSILPVFTVAGNAYAYELLYSISPEFAQKLKPVHVSCIDNGIEMNVIAAQIHGEKADILVSMHDRTGSRIDETTDLFDSYSIHTPYDQSGYCSLVEYDADTRTATFLLSIDQMHRVLITGDKITFSVRQLLLGKRHSNYRLPGTDTNTISTVTEFAEKPDVRGFAVQADERDMEGSDNDYAGSANDYAGSDNDNESTGPDRLHLIKPNETNPTVIEEGVMLTGYGFVDGKLHVQIRYDRILTTDNHGFVYLKDAEGKILDCAGSISFWDESRTNSYEEYIFSVTPDAVTQTEVWGEFWTCNNGLINGNWQVTVPVE